MTDFVFKPHLIRLLATIYAALIGIGLILFILFFSQQYQYPLWLKVLISTAALLVFYEAIAALLKPISWSGINGIHRVRYLASHYEFMLTDIESYRTISYPTRSGIRNGVILYLKNGRTLEINEVLINGDISAIISTAFKQIPRHRQQDQTLWLSRFPTRYWHKKSER